MTGSYLPLSISFALAAGHNLSISLPLAAGLLLGDDLAMELHADALFIYVS